MKHFRVLRDEMTGAASGLNELSIRTNRIADEGLTIARLISSSNQAYSDVATSLSAVGYRVLNDAQCIRALSKGLENVAESYELTEKQVAK